MNQEEYPLSARLKQIVETVKKEEVIETQLAKEKKQKECEKQADFILENIVERLEKHAAGKYSSYVVYNLMPNDLILNNLYDPMPTGVAAIILERLEKLGLKTVFHLRNNLYCIEVFWD